MAKSRRRRPKRDAIWIGNNIHWYPPRLDNEAKNAQLWVLFDQGSERCHWCGRKVQMRTKVVADAASRDHLIPKSCGGSDEIENLVLSCFSCNQRRGSMPALAFEKLIEKERCNASTA